MKLLEDRISAQGRILEGDILDVDMFLNHQLDIALLTSLGREFHNRFGKNGIDKIIKYRETQEKINNYTEEAKVNETLLYIISQILQSIIDKNKNPELFALVEMCQKNDSSQIHRLISYYKKMNLD